MELQSLPRSPPCSEPLRGLVSARKLVRRQGAGDQEFNVDVSTDARNLSDAIGAERPLAPCGARGPLQPPGKVPAEQPSEGVGSLRLTRLTEAITAPRAESSNGAGFN